MLLICALTVFGQTRNRDKIKNAINEWGTCRNVAITSYGGDIALNYRNGCAFSGNVPQKLYDALVELNNDNEFIDDIVLTEEGRYLILYGNNGFVWNTLPYGLERKMREYNNDKDLITSVAFNDNDDRIITATIPQLLIYFTIYNFLANEPINLTIFIPPLYSLPYQRDILVFLCLQDATAPYYRHGNQQ
jgi:hypothetical protein